jgi:tripartite-type tricarboxylate transporter receptor subunit TctC
MMRPIAIARTVALATGVALLATACSVGAGSQGGGGDGGSYPTGPIEMVVTYQAGGASDQLARTITPSMEQTLGQSIIVQNEPGGAGTVGMTSVIQSEPNGYKLGFIAGGPLTVQPHYGRTTYQHDDITPVAQVATAPLLLAVKADAPWQTIDDLIAHLKGGGSFTYASSGAGNPANIAMEKLDAAAGVDTNQVPFESSGEVASALLGGNVDGAAGLPSAFAGPAGSGEMRILANLGDVKGSFYQAVPTLAESGFDAVTNVTNGVVGPKGLSADVVTKLSGSIKTALEDEAISQKIEASGFVPDFGDSAAYGAALESEYQETGVVLKELGLTGG